MQQLPNLATLGCHNNEKHFFSHGWSKNLIVFQVRPFMILTTYLWSIDMKLAVSAYSHALDKMT